MVNSKRRRAIRFTGLAWLVGVAIYAAIYITDRLAQPGLEGYETEWTWQLLFFGLSRLPWLIAVLVGIILLELRIFGSRNNEPDKN